MNMVAKERQGDEQIGPAVNISHNSIDSTILGSKRTYQQLLRQNFNQRP